MIPLKDIITSTNSERSINTTENESTTLSVNQYREIHRPNRSTKLRERLIFIPGVSLYISVPSYLWYTNLSLAYSDEYWQNNIIYFICFFWVGIMISYFCAVFVSTEQSNVNKYFDSSNDVLSIDKSQPGREIKSLNPAEWGYCEYCKSFKFKRASHCRSCQKCVILRDHHCPWIANCVGFGNMQYFINFIVWILFGAIFYIYIFIKFNWCYSTLKKNENYNLSMVTLIINWLVFIFEFLTVLGLIGMLCRIVNNIYNNKTFYERTKDFSIERHIPCHVSKNNAKLSFNEHNIGFMAHFYYLIGPTLFHFFLPLPKCFHFVLNEDCPVFQKSKQPTNLEKVRFLATINPSYKNILNSPENEPDYFINLSHTHYDGKEIV